MKVLGIYGSPREKGNTDLMLDAFLEGAASAGGLIQRVYVRDLRFGGCVECGGCDATGECIQDDDLVQVYPMLDEASHLVVASPIFFYGVTGQLKLLVDRSQAPYMRRDLMKKQGEDPMLQSRRRGFLLSAGATKGKRLFECAIMTVKYFFDALCVHYVGEICYRAVEAKGAIREVPAALEECFRAGRVFLETSS
ncbi:MAG: flavodoxin family protein [Deltaproteobacteria bacterium]|nr:flavodoxin family protein [Deltaproteobacteria bacterium]